MADGLSSKTEDAAAAPSEGLTNGDGSSEGGDGSKTLNGGNPAQPCPAESKTTATGGTTSPLSVLADVALSSKEKKPGKSKNGYGKEGADGVVQNGSDDGDMEAPSDEDEGGEHFSTLRELLIRPAPKSSSKNPEQNAAPVAKRQRMETLEDVISCVIERGVDREASQDHGLASSAAAGGAAAQPATPAAAASAAAATSTSSASSSTSSSSGPAADKETSNSNPSAKTNGGEPAEVVMELRHFKRRVDAFKTVLTREALPPRIMVLCESEKQYPDIPHSWLCSGKLLRLHDPVNPNNYKIFQVCVCCTLLPSREGVILLGTSCFYKSPLFLA